MENLLDEKGKIKSIEPYFPEKEVPLSMQILEEERIQDEELKEEPEEIVPNKEEIELPKEGRLVSHFARDLVKEIKDRNTVFFRIDSRDVVEIGKIKLQKDGEDVYTGFIEVKPSRFITLIEKYINPGYEVWNDDKKRWEFKLKSMTPQTAKNVLDSEILHKHLPQINRIFTVPLPIIYKGKLTFPRRGYDPRFYSWLPYNAPDIENPSMPLEEARLIIFNLLKEFCFQSQQDYNNAVAALLTPFLRGIFKSFNIRTPVFFYLANRERAGKDYLAGITGMLYEGHALEESPISSSEGANNNEELRKKILAAMINGRKRLHFANNKGFVDNAVFEAVVTAEKHSDRILGRSDILSFENEIDFSLSGNTGVGFTPDFANRCRFIRLFLDIEDANSRKFDNPDLHHFVLKNRGLILSALFSFVRNWIEKGKPEGSLPFASFPEWAKICGGIMEAAGYDNPCMQDKEIICVGGDIETSEMKALYEVCYAKHPEEWINKAEIKKLGIDNDVLGNYNFNERSEQIKFGNLIIRFTGRVLSDIRMIVRDKNVRAARQEFKFTKEKEERQQILPQKCGNVGNTGNSLPWENLGEKSNILHGVADSPDY